MAVILFVIGSFIFIVFSMMSIIIKILKKKVKKTFIAIIILSLAVTIAGFCMVSPERPKYASSNKNYNKSEKTSISSQNDYKLKVYSIENEESVLIQYNDKNILVDVPKEPNKSDCIFKTIDKYKIKKIDSIILTCNDDNFSGNAADVITRYNIRDVYYTYDNNINDKVIEAIKAVNSVKGNNTEPQKLKNSDNVDNIPIKLEKENSVTNLIFKANESSETQLMVEPFKNYLQKVNIYKHTININHDSNGCLNISINIGAAEN